MLISASRSDVCSSELRQRPHPARVPRRRPLMKHPIISRDEGLSARKSLFTNERAMTHRLDALRAERWELPWVKIEKNYVFDGPDGHRTLSDLFGRHSQLAIYHFMLSDRKSTRLNSSH